MKSALECAEAKTGHEIAADIAVGYLVQISLWFERGAGSEATSEMLYRIADEMAGRAADARVKAAVR